MINDIFDKLNKQNIIAENFARICEGKTWEQIALSLYQILDGIDTMDDVCKENSEAFREHVLKLQSRKNQFLFSPDGYRVETVEEIVTESDEVGEEVGDPYDADSATLMKYNITQALAEGRYGGVYMSPDKLLNIVAQDNFGKDYRELTREESAWVRDDYPNYGPSGRRYLPGERESDKLFLRTESTDEKTVTTVRLEDKEGNRIVPSRTYTVMGEVKHEDETYYVTDVKIRGGEPLIIHQDLVAAVTEAVATEPEVTPDKPEHPYAEIMTKPNIGAYNRGGLDPDYGRTRNDGKYPSSKYPASRNNPGYPPDDYSKGGYNTSWPQESIEEGLASHAEKELRLAGLFDHDSDYDGMLGEAVLELMELFAGQGHSGFSGSLAAHIFGRLVKFEALTELTDNSDEWNDISEMQDGEPGWQSTRSPSCFSTDGGKTYYSLDDIAVEHEEGGCSYVTYEGEKVIRTSKPYQK